MLGIKVFKESGGGSVISQNGNAFDEIILSKVEKDDSWVHKPVGYVWSRKIYPSDFDIYVKKEYTLPFRSWYLCKERIYTSDLDVYVKKEYILQILVFM